MVSHNLKKCLPLLQALSSIKDGDKRRVFLKAFEANLHRAIKEICFNLLNGNLTLSADEKKRLGRFKKILRVLADAKTRKLQFRKAVTQTGRGFLPALIPIVVSAISSML